MRHYHKIDSIFLRDPATKNKRFIMGWYSRPEFEYLANCKWHATEKVDGTNINVTVTHPDATLEIKGHTDKANIPEFQRDRVLELFLPVAKSQAFQNAIRSYPITFHCELYGNKIQKVGKDYNPETQDLVVFDISSGDLFLELDSTEMICAKTGLINPAWLGSMTLGEAIQQCLLGFPSYINSAVQAEGLVLRPMHELRTNKGRVITKVKCRDFK